MKVGRPSKYSKGHPQQLIELMSKGALDCEIYAAWDISKDTFYKWLNEHIELKEAYDIGLPKCEAWWSIRMRERFEAGDDKGFKYCIAIMNNKFKWEKGTKSEGNTTNIQIGSMNVLQQKSRTDLLDYIQTMINKNSDIIDVQLLEDKVEATGNDGQGTP